MKIKKFNRLFINNCQKYIELTSIDQEYQNRQLEMNQLYEMDQFILGICSPRHLILW